GLGRCVYRPALLLALLRRLLRARLYLPLRLRLHAAAPRLTGLLLGLALLLTLLDGRLLRLRRLLPRPALLLPWLLGLLSLLLLRLRSWSLAGRPGLLPHCALRRARRVCAQSAVLGGAKRLQLRRARAGL